jgi:hypothetical protein
MAIINRVLPCSTKRYIMMESRVFFEPYQHVLEALQRQGHPGAVSSLPFADILTGNETEVPPPGHLLGRQNHLKQTIAQQGLSVYDMSAVFPHATEKSFDVLGEWPEEECALDSSQLRALKLALTSEVAIIQGPPGTGKV